MKKSEKKQELIREVRQRAEKALNACDEVEQGKLSAEEFEKRLSKIDWISGIAKAADWDPS